MTPQQGHIMSLLQSCLPVIFENHLLTPFISSKAQLGLQQMSCGGPLSKFNEWIPQNDGFGAFLRGRSTKTNISKIHH